MSLLYFVLVLKKALIRNKMNYIKLRDSLKDFTVFSLHDILQVDPAFHRRRLNDWQNKGYIKKVIKGFYTFSDLSLNENVLFEIANKIYKPSYISLESALSYYDLIPESTYGVTSVSTRRTYKFTTSAAEFSYRTIRRDLYFGYFIQAYNQKSFKIAFPERAIIDYLYLNSHLKNEKDFESLRVNPGIFFEKIDTKKLMDHLKIFSQKSLRDRVLRFLDYLNAQK
jgi:predicted transcriptional regulator of viral defense system